MKITWKNIKGWLETNLLGPLPDHLPAPQIHQLATDSRSIQKDEWFLPLSGENFDGHHFIEQAMEAGASGFFYQVSEKKHISLDLLKSGIPVKNVLSALQDFAKEWRLCFKKDLTLFALTGSVGKTTCKEMLFTILNPQGPTLKTEGNFNNDIGVPKTLQKLNETHKYAVLELGARHTGDIERLVNIVNPNITCCLNVGTAHIEVFKTEEAILKTKTEIFKTTCFEPKIVCFHDDQRILDVCQQSGKDYLSFGKSADADVSLVNEKWNDDGSLMLEFTIHKKLYSLLFQQGHSAYSINALAALSMGLAAGLQPTDMIAALSRFEEIGGRFKKFQKNGITFIDDSYNANPESMKAGIESISQLFPKQRKIFILGDMLELGQRSPQAHEDIGSYCQKQVSPLHLITIGTDSKFIQKQALLDGLAQDKAEHYKQVEDFLAAGIDLESRGTIVYIKGSNGIRLNKIIQHYR